jgi:hypothetical protein
MAASHWRALRAVARELGASDDDVKLGAAATVTNVRATPLEQYRVIEFATHGLVAGEVGGLSEPALVLSLPDEPTAESSPCWRRSPSPSGLNGAASAFESITTRHATARIAWAGALLAG